MNVEDKDRGVERIHDKIKVRRVMFKVLRCELVEEQHWVRKLPVDVLQLLGEAGWHMLVLGCNCCLTYK